MKPSSRRPPPLLYADSERSADALYFGKIGVPDPFIAFGLRGKKYAVVSALEFGRVRRDSAFDIVLPLEAWLQNARPPRPGARAGAAEVIQLLARKFQQTRFTVPDDFPAALFQKLGRLGLALTVAGGPLFPAREIKTAAEAAAIREAATPRQRRGGIAAAGAGAARQPRPPRPPPPATAAGRSRARRSRFAIEVGLAFAAGATSANTIAAGGDRGETRDPHHRGSGPLRPGELIIVDVFPRVNATGYHGDMTRTYLRGRPSEAQRALVAAVRAAQLAALKAIRAGVNGRAVHARVVDLFAARGYGDPVHPRRGRPDFSTAPVTARARHSRGAADQRDGRLCRKKGSVVYRREPGLYYPGIGGCRIEDVVRVTERGARLLSKYHYEWEL